MPVTIAKRPYNLGDVRGTGGGLDDSDRKLLAKMYSNSSSVFEFGLGESSHIAAHIGVSRWSGVDSDAAWVGMARDGTHRGVDRRNDHFRFYFADIGEVKEYGHPKNEKLRKIPYNYQSAPLNNELDAFDFYLVDGRYRVACACASFLHAMTRGGDMKRVRVGIHDFFVRPQYGNAILNVGEIVDRANQLAVLKLKSNVTEEDVYKIWERHIWIRD